MTTKQLKPKHEQTEPDLEHDQTKLTKPKKEFWQAIANQEAYRVKKYKPKPGHRKVKL